MQIVTHGDNMKVVRAQWTGGVRLLAVRARLNGETVHRGRWTVSYYRLLWVAAEWCRRSFDVRKVLWASSNGI